MDFTSLPEKFKVGSDASPSHSELSFPSSPPSRVWGGPQGEAGPSRTVSPSLQQAKGTPRGWLRGVPHPSARPAAETRCLTPGRAPSTRGREAEGLSESQSANTSGAPPVSAGWTLGTLKGRPAWPDPWGLGLCLGPPTPPGGRPGPCSSCPGPPRTGCVPGAGSSCHGPHALWRPGASRALPSPAGNAVRGVLGRTPRASAVGEVPHTDAAQHCPGCRPGRRGLGSPPVTALQLTAFHLVKNTYLPLKFSEARLDKE